MNCPSLHKSFLLLACPFKEVCDIQGCRHRPYSGRIVPMLRNGNFKLSSTHFLLVILSGGID